MIINLGLIWNKTCISLSTCDGNPITRGKEKRKDSTKSQVREHTIKVYSNLSCCIHADVNKRQITGGKNTYDEMEERRRGDIPRMINFWFGERALPIAKSEAKRAVSIADEQYSHLPPFRRKTFSLLAFNWIVFSLFLSFIQKKNIVIYLIDPNKAVQSPFFFFVVVEVLNLPKALYLRGKASQLAVSIF